MNARLQVLVDDDRCRELRVWEYGGLRHWSAAERYAREHGAAGVLRASGAYTLVENQDGKLRRRTWKPAEVYLVLPAK